MKEFAYLKKADFISDLEPSIALLEQPLNERFLVANDKSLNALIYAPEIDFYIKNSKDFSSLRVHKLYEARALGYDYSSEITLHAKIDKRICILYEDSELKARLINDGYKAICVSEYEFIYGGIGSLVIVTKDGEIDCDLALSKDEHENPAILNDPAKLYALTGELSYTRAIELNKSLCQLDSRRSEHCGWCVEACPSVALSSDENKLILSEIDCISCAKCVSVCPTNALDFCEFNKDCIREVAKLYTNEQIVIFQDYEKDYNLEHFLPFHIPFNLLDELILLHLVNISAKCVVIIGEISEFLAEKIQLVNDICQAITGAKAIYTNVELASVPREFQSGFSANESNFRLNKRELFALKIKDMLKGANCGTIAAKNYAKISINEDSCTLCASCAAACNTNAIMADTKSNSIIFNASLCTSCGYCVSSCAESKTIFMQKDILELSDTSFSHQRLASDELFACLECGKEFATKKSIEKIANILSTAFSDDITKKYSLYCCAECKAKIQMLKQAQVFEDNAGFFAPLEKKLNEFLRI